MTDILSHNSVLPEQTEAVKNVLLNLGSKEFSELWDQKLEEQKAENGWCLAIGRIVSYSPTCNTNQ